MSLEHRADLALAEWAKSSDGMLFVSEQKAQPIEKRKTTMAREHGDIDNQWGHLGLGWTGDKDSGTLEATPIVSYRQNVGQRRGTKRRGGKRRNRRKASA